MELTINIDDVKFERVKTAYSDWFTAQGLEVTDNVMKQQLRKEFRAVMNQKVREFEREKVLKQLDAQGDVDI